MIWDSWDLAFHDNTANMAAYDLVSGRVNVQENVIYFGTTEPFQVGQDKYLSESFLRPRMARYRDVDVTVKLQIVSAAKTDGTDEDTSRWFGIAIRALRAHHWDAYLFYIRKDGRVEFGVRGNAIEKPPPILAVSLQAVTVRVKAEGDRVQTWVNDRLYHDWPDEQREFIRKGDIYLISFATLVRIYEVEVKVKKWYAPLLRFVKRFWKVLVAIGVIGSALGLFDLLSRWFRYSTH